MGEQHFDLDNDVLPEPVVVRIQGWDIRFDPQQFTVANEIRVMAAFKAERETMAEYQETDDIEKLRETRDSMLLTALAVIQPNNPDWTRENIGERLSIVAVGKLLGFFHSMASSGSPPAQRVPPVSEPLSPPISSIPTTQRTSRSSRGSKVLVGA